MPRTHERLELTLDRAERGAWLEAKRRGGAAQVVAHDRQDVRFQTTPFTLGVASGDPSPDSVVLWTQLALDPTNGGGMPPTAVDVT